MTHDLTAEHRAEDHLLGRPREVAPICGCADSNKWVCGAGRLTHQGRTIREVVVVACTRCGMGWPVKLKENANAET